MATRKPQTRSSYFVGSRRLQSDVIGLLPPQLTAAECASLAAELKRLDCLSRAHAAGRKKPLVRFFELIADAHQTLLREAKFLLPEGAELIALPPANPTLLVAVPRLIYYDELSVKLFVNLANYCARAAKGGEPLDRWLAELRSQLPEVDRPSSNTFHFARAAYELGMPILQWQSRHLQIGFGNRAAVFKGSITHQTPSIGVSTAKQKDLCNALLAQAAFPIAEGGLVKDLAGARQRARALGYPVAVKPADLDGGEGVSSDVRSDDELAQAFKAARALSVKVMVERHISGRDYRLLLYRDQLLIAIERIPGGVTGNGSDSVATLVHRMNEDPRRGTGHDATLYRLEFDHEAELMLRRAGLTSESIPAEGVFVRLRRAANFALGGTVRLVDDIHPDNLDLARRAMRLLRLDLAGLDLILPDIARSWHETGGAVCEINAQPFIGEPLSQDFYKMILERLVPGDGRIPVVLVLGALEPTTIEAIVARVPHLAVIGAEGARLDGHPLSRAGVPWVQACQAPLFDPRAEAALCILEPAMQRPTPSPVDRFSAALVLDLVGVEDGTEISPPMVALLRRAGSNLVGRAEHGPALSRAGLDHRTLDEDGLVEQVVAALTSPVEARERRGRRALHSPERPAT